MQSSSKDLHSNIVDVKLCNSATNMSHAEIQKCVSSTQSYICRNSKKPRRFRSYFTTEQLNYLESEYKKFPYISNENRQKLARTLNLPDRAIKIWFQNRRMKEKKETNKDDSNQCILINITSQLNNVPSVQSANDEITISTLDIKNNDVKYVATKPNETININVSREQDITTTTETGDNLNKEILTDDKQNKIPSEIYMKRVTIESTNSERSKVMPPPQDTPEDLSRPKTKSPTMSTNHINKDSRTTPVYIQNCYPPYLSGKLVWNPNMGIIGGTLATPYPVSNYIHNQHNLKKANCNCDCHLQLCSQFAENPRHYIPIFSIPYSSHLQ